MITLPLKFTGRIFSTQAVYFFVEIVMNQNIDRTKKLQRRKSAKNKYINIMNICFKERKHFVIKDLQVSS